VELLLMRHGIAIDREDPDCPPEEQRQLTPEGEARTREVAQGLRSLGLKPELVASSPLLRALQTAQIAAAVLGHRGEIEEWPELAYWVDPERVLERLDGLPARQVLLVGHRPHLDLLLAAALGDPEAPFTVLKKAGVALLDWQPEGGELRWLLTPAILRRLRGAD